jgi:hypothetical protein
VNFIATLGHDVHLARTDLGEPQDCQEPNLVSRACVVPVMALAHKGGLADLVGKHVSAGSLCGVNAALGVPPPGTACGAGGQHR